MKLQSMPRVWLALLIAALALFSPTGVAAQQLSITSFRGSFSGGGYSPVINSSHSYVMGAGTLTMSFSGFVLPTGVTSADVSVTVKDPTAAICSVTKNTVLRKSNSSVQLTFSIPAHSSKYDVSAAATVTYVLPDDDPTEPGATKTVNVTCPTPLSVYPAVSITAPDKIAEKTRDDTPLNLSFSLAAPQGGNPTGWSYSWNRSFSSATTQLSTSLSASDHSTLDISGYSRVTSKATYSVTVTNKLPNGDVWYTNTLDAGSVTVYNVPNAPHGIEYFTMPDGSGVTFATYLDVPVAAPSNYLYLFDGNERSTRRYAGSAENVATRFRYPDGEIVDSKPFEGRSVSEPNLKVSGTVTGSGYSPVLHDGKWYGLAGSTSLELTDAGSSFGSADLTLNNVSYSGKTSAFSVSKAVIAADAADDNPAVTVNATASFAIETGLKQNFSVSWQVKDFATVYGAPVFNDIATVTKTGRDDREAGVSLDAGSAQGGNPDGWKYVWQRIENNAALGASVAGKTYEDNEVYDIPALTKAHRSVKYHLTVTNEAPNGSIWFTREYDPCVLNVLNVPNTPAGLVALSYPDGVTHESIITGIGIAEEAPADYLFVFGDNNVSSTRYAQGIADKGRTRFVYDEFGGVNVDSDPVSLTQTVVAAPEFDAALGVGSITRDTYHPDKVDALWYGWAGGSVNIWGHVGFGSYVSSITEYAYAGASVAGSNDTQATLSTPDADGNMSVTYSGYVDVPVETSLDLRREFTAVYKDFAVILASPAYSALDKISEMRRDDRGVALSIKSDMANGANPDGWSYLWERKVGDGAYETVSETPSLVDNSVFYIDGPQHSVLNVDYRLTVSNQSPSGIIWWTETYPVAALTICNAPNAPARLDRYSLPDGSIVSYAAGMGLSEMSPADYYIYFDDIETTSRRYNDAAKEVYTMFKYDGGDGKDFLVPSEHVMVGSAMAPQLTITPSLEKTDAQEMYADYQPIEHDGRWYGWSNGSLLVDAAGTVGEAEVVFNEAAYGAIVNPFAAGHVVIPTAEPDDNVSLLLSCSATVTVDEGLTDKIDFTKQIQDFATIFPCATWVAPEVKEIAADDDKEAGVSLDGCEVAGAYSDGWSYEWVRQEAGQDAEDLATGSTFSDSSIFDIDGSGQATRSFDYKMRLVNTAPDGQTRWFVKELDAAQLTVYNVPNRPARLVGYEMTRNGDIVNYAIAHDTDAADDADYIYLFGDDETGSASPVNAASPSPTSVKTRFVYPDGHTVDSETVAMESEIVKPVWNFSIVEIQDPQLAEDIMFAGYQNIEGKIHALEGTEVKFNLSAELQNGTVTDIHITTSHGENIADEFDYEASHLGDMSFTAYGSAAVAVDKDLVQNMDFEFDRSIEACIYPVPVAPAVAAVNGELMIQDTQTSDISMTVTPPAGGAGAWSMLWNRYTDADTQPEIVGDADTPTYTDACLYDIAGPAKSISNKKFTLSYGDTGPEGTIWIWGELPVAELMVFNTPNAVGEARAYRFDADAVEYVAMNIGLTDDEIAANEVEVLYDGIPTETGRYLRSATAPAAVATRYIYEGGDESAPYRFEAISASVDVPAEPIAPVIDLSVVSMSKGELEEDAWYKGSVVTADDNICHGIAGSQITLATSATVEGNETTFVTYSHDGEAFETDTFSTSSDGVETPVEHRFSSSFEYEARVDANQTHVYPFESDGMMLAVTYPKPVYPSIETLAAVQMRDIDPANISIQASEPSGAVDAAWSLRWDVNGEPTEQTVAAYTDSDMHEIAGDEMKRDEYVYTLAFSNAAPDGSLWIEGVIDAGKTYVYNTPMAPARIDKIITPEHTAYIASDMGMTDDELTARSYKFSFGDDTLLNERALKMANDEVSDVETVHTEWEYPDGYVCSSDAVAYNPADFVQLQWVEDPEPYMDLVTYREEGDNGFYLGPQREGQQFYGLLGYDRIATISRAVITGNDALIARSARVEKAELNLMGDEPQSASSLDLTDITAGEIEPQQSGDYQLNHTIAFSYWPEAAHEASQYVDSSVCETGRLKMFENFMIPNVSTDAENLKYDDTEVVNMSFSYDLASGANPDGWSYKMTLDGEDMDSADMSKQFEIAAEEPGKEIHTVHLELSNIAPNGVEWIHGIDDGVEFAVYNAPEQPDWIHFIDKEGNSGNEFYVAANTGYTDQEISENHVAFRFGGNIGESRRNAGAMPSDMQLVWIYKDAEDNVEHVSPRLSAVPAPEKIKEYSMSYSLPIVATREGGDERFLVDAVTDSEGLQHALAGANLSCDNQSKTVGEGFESELNIVNKLYKSPSTAVANSNNIPVGTYYYATTITGEFSVESEAEQKTSFSCSYSAKESKVENENIRIWAAPSVPYISAQGESGVASWVFRDIDDVNVPMSLRNLTGGTTNWQYQWSLRETPIFIDGSVVDDQEPVYDGAIEGAVELSYNPSMPFAIDNRARECHGLLYSIEFTNISPDGVTPWYASRAEYSKKPVYVMNTPQQPGRVLSFKNDATGRKYVVADLGLNDLDIEELAYNFRFYAKGSSQVAESASRARSAVSSKDLASCRAHWDYSDIIGDAALGAALSDPTEVTAVNNPKIEFAVSASNGNSDISEYQGPVTDKERLTIYLLSGDKARVAAAVTDLDPEVSFSEMTVYSGSGNPSADIVGTYYRPFEFEAESGAYLFDATVKSHTPIETLESETLMCDIPCEVSWNGGVKNMTAYNIPVLPVANKSYQQKQDNQVPDSFSFTLASQAIPDSWSYQWKRNGANVDGSGNQYSFEDAIDVPGEDPLSNVYSYSVAYSNKTPNEVEWIKGDVDVCDVTVYNTPNTPGGIARFRADDIDRYYVVNTGYSNEQLDQHSYNFRFSNGACISGGSRFIDNDGTAVDGVCSYWTYPDGFEAVSAKAGLVSDFTASLGSFKRNVMFNPSFDGYSGSKTDAEGVVYALQGTELHYVFVVDGTEEAPVLSLERLNLDGSSTGDKVTLHSGQKTVCSVPGIYVPSIDAKFGMKYEESLSDHFQVTFSLPGNTESYIYPAPVAPKVLDGAQIRFRDIDPIIPAFVPGYGACADGWRYSVGDMSLDEPNYSFRHPIDEMQKKYEDVTVTLNYKNTLPDGQTFINSSVDFTARVYNTPELPYAFDPKGNGTSHIWIATFSDAALNSNPYDYTFQFGEGDEVVAESAERWHRYPSEPNSPWVSTKWVYDDGYVCVSDRLNPDGSSSSRAEDTAIESVIADSSIEVYTLDGLRVDMAERGALRQGFYIVRKISGQNSTVTKIYVK